MWASPSGLGFDVKTREGHALNAPWGSWLAVDSAGKFYPIAAAEQAAIYEEATP